MKTINKRLFKWSTLYKEVRFNPFPETRTKYAVLSVKNCGVNESEHDKYVNALTCLSRDKHLDRDLESCLVVSGGTFSIMAVLAILEARSLYCFSREGLSRNDMEYVTKCLEFKYIWGDWD